MAFSSFKSKELVFAAIAGLLAAAMVTSVCAQEKKVPQSAGVDNSKMGPYRALAQHTFAEFQKGDNAAAAQLARVLERVWDKGEDYGGDTALKKTHPDLFEEIDKAMDEFITPLTEYKTKTPDPAKVKAGLQQLSRDAEAGGLVTPTKGMECHLPAGVCRYSQASRACVGQ